MYEENRDKFERDLKRFMWKEGKSTQKIPVWHNHCLNLFQLYMTVYELGGSEMVSAGLATW